MGYEMLTLRNGRLASMVGDDYSGALVIIDSDHWENHEGMLFSAYHENTSVAGATFAFSFKTPPISAGIVHYRTAGIQPTADNVRVQIWEGATVNVAGTLVNVDCNNRIVNTAVPLGLEFRAGTTFSNNGILLTGFQSFLPGTVGVGQARVGSSAGASLDELIMKPNTVYRFVNINGSTVSNTIASKFRFYIVTGGE